MRTEQREVTTPSIWAGFRLAKMSTKEVRCKTCTGIAEFLKSNWVPTPSGKSCKWTKNTVYSILTNEKYKGDALLQKKYTADYLEYRMVTNNGELPQYYVEKNHHASQGNGADRNGAQVYDWSRLFGQLEIRLETDMR